MKNDKTRHPLASLSTAFHRKSLLDIIRQTRDFLGIVPVANQLEVVEAVEHDYHVLLSDMRTHGQLFTEGDEFEERLDELYRRISTVYDAILFHMEFVNEEGSLHDVWKRVHASSEEGVIHYLPFVEGPNGRPATLSEVLQDPLCSYQQVFDTVWTTPVWSETDRIAALEYVCDEEHPELVRTTLIHAASVALLTSYDETKWQFLLDALLTYRIPTTVPAVVGLTVALIRYNSRFRHHPRLLRQMAELLSCDEDIRLLMRTAFKLFYGIRRSGKILIDDPHLVKMNMLVFLSERKLQCNEYGCSPDYKDPDPNEFAEADMDLSELGDMPDALIVGRDFAKGLRAKMIQVALGLDVNLFGFREIVKDLQFFKSGANWFCPFTTDNPYLFNLDPVTRVLSAMPQEHECPSDRYALLLSMADSHPEVKIIKKDMVTQEEEVITEDGIEQFLEMVTKDTDHEDDAENELRGLTEDKAFALCRPDMMAFNRFFSLYDLPVPYRVFRLPVAPRIPRIYNQLFTSEEELLDFADYLHCVQDYSNALEIYACEKLPLSAEAQVRICHCHEALKEYDTAIAGYESSLKGNLPSNVEQIVLQRLEELYFHKKDYRRAMEYLDRRRSAAPDDESLLRQRAILFIIDKRYDDAYPVLNQLQYLHPEDRQLLRELLVCCLYTQRYERAVRLADSLLAGESPIRADYVLAGHAYLLSDDMITAIVYYQEADAMESENDFNAEGFFSDDDAYILSSAGITGDKLKILNDMIRN